jgi:hypothetical protein
VKQLIKDLNQVQVDLVRISGSIPLKKRGEGMVVNAVAMDGQQIFEKMDKVFSEHLLPFAEEVIDKWSLQTNPALAKSINQKANKVFNQSTLTQVANILNDQDLMAKAIAKTQQRLNDNLRVIG